MVRDALWDAGNLRDLQIYEDIGRPDRHVSDAVMCEELRREELLGENLCKASRHLRKLCVLHVLDAKDFLSPFWPKREDPNELEKPGWVNLEHLTLTSTGLYQPTWRDLIIAAGRAAKKMPRLKMMEIFTGGHGLACVFRYERLTDTSTLLLSSTCTGDYLGHANMRSEARSCWEEVSRVHHSLFSTPKPPLKITKRHLWNEDFDNYTDVLAMSKGCGNLYSRITAHARGLTEE